MQPIQGSKKEGHLHKVGSKEAVLGVVIDEALIGKTEGQIAEVIQEYPAAHPDERLAGKCVSFRISITGVKQKNLPVLDDEFAKDCGPYESLIQLKEKARKELEVALKHNIEEGYKDQIAERLLQMHHFDLPEVLVEREVRVMVRQQVMEEQRKISQGGGNKDQAFWEEEVKRLQQELAPEAKRRVKLGLIFEAIANKEGIIVSDQEIQDEIAKLAKNLQLPLEDIQKMVESGGQGSRQEFEERLRAEKALQFVFQHAVIQG